MDQISSIALKNGGKSRMTPFKIELTGCELGSMKSATAKFTGSPAGNTDLLAIRGSAQGASLATADHTGALIKLGTESPAQPLSDGDTFLQCNAYLQGNMEAPEGGGAAKPAAIVPGTYETFANFPLDYQ